MPFLELFDETLDINATGNYELSVQVSFDRVSFCILDTIRKKFVLIREFEPEIQSYQNRDKISDFISMDDFLLKPYKKVHVITPSPAFTLVPAPLYDQSKMEDYFSFNHTREEGTIICCDKITSPDSCLIYSISEQLASVVDKFFMKSERMHHLKPFLSNISEHKKGLHENHIHLHIERDFFNIVVYGNYTLKLCNSYNYKSGSDILYYLLSAFRILSLRQEETVYLSGLIKPGDEFSILLSGYHKNVKYSLPSNKYSFSYVFNESGLHRYLNLFNSLTCE
jgi:hypothetical protein